MSDALKVGSKIWTINPRHRREGWKSDVITGETRASWLVGDRKINKATMLENHGYDWGKQRWYSPACKDARWFIDVNCSKITQEVSHLNYGPTTDVIDVAAKLKQIAEILGMELSCNPPS